MTTGAVLDKYLALLDPPLSGPQVVVQRAIVGNQASSFAAMQAFMTVLAQAVTGDPGKDAKDGGGMRDQAYDFIKGLANANDGASLKKYAWLDAAARARWLVSNIRTPEQVEALNLARFGAKLESAAGTLRGGLPVAFGVLGVVANWLALDSVRDGERKAMQHNKSEGLRRIYAQGAQTIGAVASTVEAGLAKIPALASSFARGVQTTSVRALGLIGRVLGVGGSLLMAGIDAWKAVQEGKQGNVQGVVAYGVAAGLGAAATLLLLFGFTGIGLVVVVIAIAWAFISADMVDNGLQDWLERCMWGKAIGERFESSEVEIAQLKVALG